jgi:Xaa-Pro aminopeptidase
MRLEKLRGAIAEMGIESMLVSRAENMRYVSGYTGGDGHLLVTADKAWIITDFRYYEQVSREAPDFELFKMTDGFTKLVPQLIGETGVQQIGFESGFITYDQHAAWSAAGPSVEWTPTKDVILDLRALKDADELDAIRKAVAIGDEAIEYVMGIMKPGMTESEVAWELEVQMRTRGASRLSFPVIVGSGPNGAMPHAVTSERVIQPGEPIVIDMGCVVDGYCSDMTRTFCLGKPADWNKYETVWNTVLEAQQRSRDAIKPGMTGQAAHALSFDVINRAGYGAHYGHGLGHGVGLAIHENPRMGRTSENILQPGAVLTVEPGIYLEGWGGVRIEDMGVLTENGMDIFTAAQKIAIVD